MANLLESICIGGLLSSVISADAFDINLEWNPPTNYVPHGYIVSWDNIPRDFNYGEYRNSMDVGVTNIGVISNLVSGSTFYASVKCYSQYGMTAYSNEVMLQDTNAANLQAPSGFSVVLNSLSTNNPPDYRGNFSFSWSPVVDANGYHISYFRKYERPESFYAGNTLNFSTNISILPIGADYYFGVAATNNLTQNNGPMTMATNAVPSIVDLPLPPSKVSISGITNLNGPDAWGALVLLNWTPCPNRAPQNVEYYFYTKFGPCEWEYRITGNATNTEVLHFPNSPFEGWRVVTHDKLNNLYGEPSQPISGNTSYPMGFPVLPPSNLRLKVR